MARARAKYGSGRNVRPDPDATRAHVVRAGRRIQVILAQLLQANRQSLPHTDVSASL